MSAFFRIKSAFFALGVLSVLILFPPLVPAIITPHSITPLQSLDAVAKAIKDSGAAGTHVIRFSTYGKVGQFKLETPSPGIDSIIFERNPDQESDSAIRVGGDTALIEIKDMDKGTLVLRGLAINLALPQARLLAAGEKDKENFNLLIDSCFIFGDNVASTFINWAGAAGSKVEIKRSFLVFKTGTTAANLLLSAPEVKLTNNIFHYSGLLDATLLNGGRIEVWSNTIHRTQFKLSTVLPDGATYSFSQNFIGHRGEVDAFGGGGGLPSFLYATGFYKGGSSVQNTKLSNAWGSFDHLGSSLKLFGDAISNTQGVVIGKPASELWNWYDSDTLALVGFNSGLAKRVGRYNVWPGEASHKFRLGRDSATANFRPAPFPRQFKPAATLIKPPKDSILAADLRILAPLDGAWHFGPFQVEKFDLAMTARWGRPVLLAGGPAGPYIPQRITGKQDSSLSPFPNDSLSARYYFFAFQGNTKRGAKIAPDPATSRLAAGDTLLFFRVDSAGFTSVKASARDFPNDLRNLGASLNVSTTASVSDSMTFGSRDTIPPWSRDKVFWWIPATQAMHPAKRDTIGKYHVTVPAQSSFIAYLVEKHNVKRGVTVFPLPGQAEARVFSPNGFQLSIDSAASADSRKFGRASRVFSFSWVGRGANDSILLQLPGGTDMEPILLRGDTLDTPVYRREANGTFQVTVSPADQGKKFFSAIRFNVMGGVDPFQGILDSVTVSGLISSTSGKIGIGSLDPGMVDRIVTSKDTLPANKRVLGGRSIRTLDLSLKQSYQVAFKILKAGYPDSVAAYAWNGQGWELLFQPTVRPSDSAYVTIQGLELKHQAVIVVERLQPAHNYVDTTLTISAEERTVTVKSKVKNSEMNTITGFTLLVRHVDEFGFVQTDSSKKMSIGDSAKMDLKDKSGLFMYGIQYHTAAGRYGDPAFTRVEKFNWKREMLRIGKDSLKEAGHWYVVGFPYGGKLTGSFANQKTDAGAPDVRAVFHLSTKDSGNVGWDSLPLEQVEPKPGEAYLFGASQPHLHLVNTQATFEPPLEKSITAGPTAGWKLISPPFPMPFHSSKVGSSLGRPEPFLVLKSDVAASSSDQKRDYRWETTDTLMPFQGYAYYFEANDTLTFDPWDAGASPPTAKVSAAETPAVEVTLTVGRMRRSMRLLSGPGARNIPLLPAPGEGIEVKVGGRGGYLRKKVENLRGIDETLVVDSPERIRAALTVVPSGAAAGQGGWRVRLIDLVSGTVHDESSLGDLELPTGSSEYRLVAGDEGFVGERIRRFQAGAPRDIGLSQNFPNPFRRSTRIALDWPALSGARGADETRKAWLEIFDTRGKVVQRMDLGPIRVGRQVVALDAASWQAGIYTYRLTVAAAGRRVQLQKRMLVTR